MGRRAADDRGFSLVEVLVSLSILSVGLLALALMQVTAIKGNATAARSMMATKIGQDKLESFRREAWASIVSSNGTIAPSWTTANVYTILPANNGGDNVVQDTTTFYRAWRVVNNGTLKTITVWTCWRDERGVWHGVTLAAERANI